MGKSWGRHRICLRDQKPPVWGQFNQVGAKKERERRSSSRQRSQVGFNLVYYADLVDMVSSYTFVPAFVNWIPLGWLAAPAIT